MLLLLQKHEIKIKQKMKSHKKLNRFLGYLNTFLHPYKQNFIKSFLRFLNNIKNCNKMLQFF